MCKWDEMGCVGWGVRGDCGLLPSLGEEAESPPKLLGNSFCPSLTSAIGLGTGRPLPGTWGRAGVQSGAPPTAGTSGRADAGWLRLCRERGIGDGKAKDGDQTPSPPCLHPGETIHVAPLPSPCPHCAWWDPRGLGGLGGAAAVVGSGVPWPFLGGHGERWVVSLLAGGFCGVRRWCRGQGKRR